MDVRIVTPDQIEDLAVTVLRDRHDEHLAKLERLRGLRPRTLLRLKNVALFSDPVGQRSPSEKVLPAVLLGTVGVGKLEQDEDDALNATLTMGLEVSVIGRNRRDTLRRRDWTAFTVIECLLQRLPRNELVHAVELTDYEPLVDADRTRYLAQARIVLEIEVVQMLSRRGLPATDTQWPDGEPGGAPPDGEPYTPPLDPPTARTFTPTIDREPLVE
jgi:hypothetical protein